MVATPARTCIGCRQVAPADGLLRLVRSQQDPQLIVWDQQRKLPGRGAWLHASASCLAKAQSRSSLPRAFRAPVRLDALAAQQLQAYLTGQAPG